MEVLGKTTGLNQIIYTGKIGLTGYWQDSPTEWVWQIIFRVSDDLNCR